MRVVHVPDNPNSRETLSFIASSSAYEVDCYKSPEFIICFTSEHWDLGKFLETV